MQESMTDENRTGPKTRKQGVELERDQKQESSRRHLSHNSRDKSRKTDVKNDSCASVGRRQRRTQTEEGERDTLE